jgi:hypothetical protein
MYMPQRTRDVGESEPRTRGPFTFAGTDGRGGGLRGLADVAVVQAADFGKLHDPAGRGELDRPGVWSILAEREMGPRVMVVGEVSGQDTAELSLTEDEHVIQALTPNRADEPWDARSR